MKENSWTQHAPRRPDAEGTPHGGKSPRRYSQTFMLKALGGKMKTRLEPLPF